MQRIIAILATVCLVFTGGAYAISGSITASETWSGTVTLDDDVSIEAGTVTIEPGTRIEAASGAQLQITGSGAIYAVGASDNMIIFTSAAGSPAAGDWSGLFFNTCSNEAAMAFEYCIVEYAGSGLTSGIWADAASIAEPSDISAEHCIIRHMSSNGVYATARADIRIDNSLVYDCSHAGLFLHGTDSCFITNTVLYDHAAGIVCPGSDEADRYYAIDHVTMYNIDLMMVNGTSKWWHGYGIFPCNTTGTLSVTNSVIVQATLAGMVISSWPLTENNNCWYTGLLGLANIEDGTPGTGSIEQDPLFTDADARDLSLGTGSPAIDAASDGSNMGAWQDVDFWYAPYVSGIRNAGSLASAVPGVRVIADGIGGTVTVHASAPHDASLCVGSLDGIDSHVLARSISAGTNTYSLDSMASGVYVVTVMDGSRVLSAAQVAVLH